jgi:hypothetical protein
MATSFHLFDDDLPPLPVPRKPLATETYVYWPDETTDPRTLPAPPFVNLTKAISWYNTRLRSFNLKDIELYIEKYVKDPDFEAHLELQNRLLAGAINAFHKEASTGQIRQIKSEAWTNDGALLTEIKRNNNRQWSDWIQVRSDLLKPGYFLEGNIVFAEETIRSSLINLGLKETVDPDNSLPIITSNNASSPGRPPKYDGEYLILQALVTTDELGVPKTLAQLVKMSLELYVIGRPGKDIPTDRWAEKKLQPFWRVLERRTRD